LESNTNADSSYEVLLFRATVDELANVRLPLDPAEVMRKRRYRSRSARARFTCGRVLLRLALGQVLGRSSEGIALTLDPMGRPRLCEAGGPGVEFSLSHAGHHIAVALSLRAQAIGVDVEASPVRVDIERIAGRFFSETERSAVLEAPPTERERQFLRIWTAKEACSKALGCGLWPALTDIEVSLSPSRLLRLPFGEDQERWALWYEEAPPGVACTVAASPPGFEVVCRAVRLNDCGMVSGGST